MFRIRKIYDDTSPAYREAITEAQAIMRKQFPRSDDDDIEKLPRQLHDPMQYQYRTVLFVAEDGLGKIRGFAVLLHMATQRFA